MKAPLIIIFAYILIGGCKKYPEDENLSLKRPDSRIRGEWDLTGFFVNSEDSSSKIIEFQYNRWSFGDDYKGLNSVVFLESTGTKSFVVYYNFKDDKNVLRIHRGRSFRIKYSGLDIISSRPSPNEGDEFIFDIIRLEKKTFWIRTFQNKNYELHFSKK